MTKKHSPILDAVHETARDLHEGGFIDARRMRRYDALCLPPVENFAAKDIKVLRERLSLSQTVLAAVLNTSPSTVRQWESGHKHPSGPSLKLLSILSRKGLDAFV